MPYAAICDTIVHMKWKARETKHVNLVTDKYNQVLEIGKIKPSTKRKGA